MNTISLSKGIIGSFLVLASSRAFGLTESFTATALDYVFYTFAFSGLVFSTLTILAYRELKWLVYVALGLLLIVNAAAMDGSLTLLIGQTDFTTWVVPFLSTTVAASFGFLVVALGLSPSHRLGRLRPTFFILSAIAALFTASTALWLEKIPITLMWIPAIVLFFSMVVCQVLPPLTWPSYTPGLRWFIRLFPFVAALFSLGGYIAFSGSFVESQQDLNRVYRWSLLIFAFFSLTIVIWQIAGQRQAKESAERKALEAEKQEAELQLALHDADKAYREALSMAARHRNQLETVSHDLKQPIIALRLAADQLRQSKSLEAEKLSRAIDYIDSLSHSYIRSAPSQDEPQTESKETVSTRLLGNALQQMFEAEASLKGIQLSLIPMNHMVSIEPLSTMRIMTNLISNALTHSAASRILIGFRKVQNRIVFQVHDNGCGINDIDQARIFEAGQKGNESTGQGLGLNIVQELCSAADMPFSIQSNANIGTSMYVSMPCSLQESA
ncbi:MFS domain-containing histidine kinase [Pseudoteredinibacter isoporae]|uniref:MFS domain-containing histidine kinase n=1 Tax=Pseudoteredinibacter isoporae TaxID=570281 RepID=UPI00333F5D3D